VSVPAVLAPHGRVPAYAEGTARASRRPSGRTLGVLVALALGALAVVVVVVPQVPALARAIGMAPAPPAPAPMVTVTALVTATASCVSAEPHDQVVLDVAGARRQAVLDGCGRLPGTPVPVLVAADGHLAGPVAVVGSGSRTPTATTGVDGQGVSPLVARLELALAVAAALGAGSLLVVLARGGSRRPAAGTRRRTGGARAGTGRVPAQRRRPAAPRRTTGPHAVRPTRVRATRPAARASTRRPATTRRRR
jgi:hypothetical protein